MDPAEEAEEVQNWGWLNKQAATLTAPAFQPANETLPKRADKYFDQDGLHVQHDTIASARHEMYVALLHVRGHHTKQLLEAVWMPAQQRALVARARGNFFRDIGVAHTFKAKPQVQGVWLSPIETVYLAERGSLVVYLCNEQFLDFMDSADPDFDHLSLQALTLSEIYAHAFSAPGMLDRFLVYALLKRLGYLVLDFRQFAPHDGAYTQLQTKLSSPLPWTQRVADALGKLGAWGRTLLQTYYQGYSHHLTYTLAFESLSLVQRYRPFESLALPPQENTCTPVFNVWKPLPRFSKKNPPLPDFQVAIVNVAESPFPDLAAIQTSWNRLNFDPAQEPEAKTTPRADTKPPSKDKPTKKELRLQRKEAREANMHPQLLQRTKYLQLRDRKLKRGTTGRSVVLAVVDNGIVNFASFSETDFSLQHAPDLDQLEQRNHGIVWNEKVAI